MKEYPAFIIDRSRRSESSRFSDDFIVCTDREVGFIARVYKLTKSRRAEFEQSIACLSESQIDNRYYFAIIGNVLCVLEVVRMLHEPVAHINRLRPLMKKAFKAYIHGEESAVRRDGQPYDDQIAALDDILRMAKSQRSRMVDMNGEAATERFTSAIQSARDSVALLQKITQHE